MSGSKPIHRDCYTLIRGAEPKGRCPGARFAGPCMAGERCLHGGRVRPGDAIAFLRTRKRPDGRDEIDEAAESANASNSPAPPSSPASVPTTGAPNPAPSSDPVAAALAAILLPLVASQVDAKVSERLAACDPSSVLAEATAAIEARIAELNVPTRIEVKRADGHIEDMGYQHKQFRQLLAYLASGQNVYIVGPAGTGKTTAVENAYKALGKPLNALSSITDRHGEVYGIRDAHGTYHESLVFDAYTRGKGMLVDEIDGSEPAELLAFNQVTANGRASFCNQMAERHPECQFVATANTFGTGANAEYTGRARLDASTLDRFVILEWGIDETLEMNTCADKAWCKYVQGVRARVAAKGLKHLVTPRASYKGAALLASLRAHEFSDSDAWEMACKSVLRRNLTDAQWDSIK